MDLGGGGGVQVIYCCRLQDAFLVVGMIGHVDPRFFFREPGIKASIRAPPPPPPPPIHLLENEQRYVDMPNPIASQTSPV